MNLHPDVHDIFQVSVPVFGAFGEVVLGVTAQGFTEPLDASTATRVAARVRACTRTISRRAGLHSSEVGLTSGVTTVPLSGRRGKRDG